MTFRFNTLLLIFIMTGCATLGKTTPIPANSLHPPTAAHFVPSISPTLTVAPISSVTPTSIMNGLAPTITALPLDERMFYLFEYPVCRFPCWVGIIPGQTHWTDAVKMFNLSGLTPHAFESRGGYVAHEVVDYLPNSTYFLNFRIYENNKVVEFISIESYLPKEEFEQLYAAYDPQKIIEKYGNPSRIYLYTSQLNIPSYTISLFYDQAGFLISYGGKAKSSNASKMEICPHIGKGSIAGAGIYLQSSEILSPIEKYPGERKSFDIIMPDMRSIEDATGLTTDEFARQLAESQSGCFTLQE